MSGDLKIALSKWLIDDPEKRTEALAEVKDCVRRIFHDKASAYLRLKVQELLPKARPDELRATINKALETVRTGLEFHIGAYTQSIESELDELLDEYINEQPDDINAFLKPRVDKLFSETHSASDCVGQIIDSWVKERGK